MPLTAKMASAPPVKDRIHHIGRNIAHQRSLKKIRSCDLAVMTGYTKATISRIEHGAARPSMESLFLIADALEVPVAAFFEGV